MNGPKLWGDLLSAINIPGAVVAGGCIRDWCLSVEHKDIDIFIPVTSREDMISKLFDSSADDIVRNPFGYVWSTPYGEPRFGKLDMIEPSEHANPKDKRYAEYDDAFGETGVLHGVAVGEFMGQEVNIIGRKAHEDGVDALINSFDFGILQAAWNGKSLEYTKAQAIECRQRTATMAHDRHPMQSIERFMRFNRRHPGVLALVVPFGFDYA